jgi:hypothetical protein
MKQPEITEAEFEIDSSGGPKTREEALQEQESKKAGKASQPMPGEGKLSPWKFPRKTE